MIIQRGKCILYDISIPNGEIRICVSMQMQTVKRKFTENKTAKENPENSGAFRVLSVFML